MAKKNGMNRKAFQAAQLVAQLWLKDPDENADITYYLAKAYMAGYRFGRKVERKEWHDAAGIGGP